MHYAQHSPPSANLQRARMLSKSNIKTLNGSSSSLMPSPSNNAEEQAAAGSQGDTTHLDAISAEGGDDTGIRMTKHPQMRRS